MAASSGHLNVVRFFIEGMKCNPNVRHHLGSTPLHMAASSGHLNIVRFFIEDMKCDPNVRNHLGSTPLHMAASSGHLNIVRFFIEDMKCDPNVRNHLGWSPLISAIDKGQSDVSKYLISLEVCDVTTHLLHDDTPTNPVDLLVRRRDLTTLNHLCTTRRIDPQLQLEKIRTMQGKAASRHIAFSEDTIVEFIRSYVDPLHHAAMTGDMESVRHYVEGKRYCPKEYDRHGNNLLHNAARHGQLEVVKYLTNLNNIGDRFLCDPQVLNGDGQTAQSIASQNGQSHVVSYLLRATLNQPVLQRDVLSPQINIFVVGNSGSGKSTLIKALNDESILFGSLFKVKGVTPLTAGIVRSTVHSRVFGKVNIYDFAGHEEYYASHEMILQQTTQPIVLLTMDISLPQHDIEKQLLYWLTILSNSVNSSTEALNTLHVVVIGSHADQMKFKERTEIYRQMKSLLKSVTTLKYHDVVQCDCRYSTSDNLNQLRQKLNNICRCVQLKLAQNENEDTNRSCASLLHHLKQSEPEQVTITVGELCKRIRDLESEESDLASLGNQDRLVEISKVLSSNRHLLYLPHAQDTGQSLLVLDENVILSHVHACLGEMKKELGNEVGILEEKQLKEILEKSLGNTMEPEQAIKYLILAQFCTRISADHLFTSRNETYYFFPNLVLASRPEDLFPGEHDYSHLYTWLLECTNARQFFTPRFLHTLFIQLIKCEEDTANTEYVIWKNGILLAHNNGTRSILEVRDQTTRVYLSMRCVEGSQPHLVKQRSMLISLIKSLVQRVCPVVDVEEFLLVPHTMYPPDKSIALPIAKVALAVSNSHRFVSYKCRDESTLRQVLIKDLLFFDSFRILKGQELQETFNQAQTEGVASVASLKRSCGCSELEEMFEIIAMQGTRKVTNRELLKYLAQYSIFTDQEYENVSHYIII
jgi:ankyrin repeat protein